jgi:hypothetical protein
MLQVTVRNECPSFFVISPELPMKHMLEMGTEGSEGRKSLLSWVSDLQEVGQAFRIF